jgi:hypothetical protein
VIGHQAETFQYRNDQYHAVAAAQVHSDTQILHRHEIAQDAGGVADVGMLRMVVFAKFLDGGVVPANLVRRECRALNENGRNYRPFAGLVERKGIEPSTSALRTQRSPSLSYLPVTLLLLGMPIVFSQGSVVAPFIYTLF